MFAHGIEHHDIAAHATTHTRIHVDMMIAQHPHAPTHTPTHYPIRSGNKICTWIEGGKGDLRVRPAFHLLDVLILPSGTHGLGATARPRLLHRIGPRERPQGGHGMGVSDVQSDTVSVARGGSTQSYGVAILQ